jgi:Protease subunit of ATP-dependent Clp proteases
LLKERLNLIYVEHTGQKLSDVEKALDRDNFMTAEDAQKWGIIDKIIANREET